MFESLTVFVFDFFESVEVELPDEALEFRVSEELGENFCLNSFFIKNIDKSSSLVPGNNFDVGGVLALKI